MRISLIVAMDENGLIGRGGGTPWHLPMDLRHFRSKTLHKPILMGRRTFEAIGKPLPGRGSLVLSRDAGYAPAGAQRVATFRQARDVARAREAGELVVIGGAEVYALTLPRVKRIYLTRVHNAFDGDTFFPDIDWSEWEQMDRRRYAADIDNPIAFSFIELRRRN